MMSMQQHAHYSWRALIVMMAVAGCGGPKAAPKPPVAVTVATAERGTAPFALDANGVVEPLQTVAVQSQVGGVLRSVHFHEGDEVTAGQLLFEIDPIPYEAALRQAEAMLARDEAQHRNAVREAERYAALAQKDYVTRSQADQSAANAEALKAVVDADRASVASARFNVDNASIHAPVAGKTGSLFVRQGNLVRPGTNTPLVVINQIHPIYVRFAVADKDLPNVQRYAAQKELRVTAIPRGDTRPVSGRLRFIDNGVDTTTGTVTLKAQFENRDGTLWPGQFVAVMLELFVEPDVVMVPTTAVVNGQEGSFVFVVDEQGKARVRPVQAPRTVADRTVIAAGLSGGERVVTDGQLRLTEGATVDVKERPTAAAAKGGKP